jgi:hypothetical protein
MEGSHTEYSTRYVIAAPGQGAFSEGDAKALRKERFGQ